MEQKSNKKIKSAIIVIVILLVVAIPIAVNFGKNDVKSESSGKKEQVKLENDNEIAETTTISSFNLTEIITDEAYDFYELDTIGNYSAIHADKIKEIIESGNANYPYIHVSNEKLSYNEALMMDDVKTTVNAVTSEEFKKILPVTYNTALEVYGSTNDMSKTSIRNYNNPACLAESAGVIIRNIASRTNYENTQFGDIAFDFPSQGTFLYNPPRTLKNVKSPTFENGAYCNLVEANVPANDSLYRAGLELTNGNVKVKTLISDDFDYDGYVGAVVEANVTCKQCPEELKDLPWLPKEGESKIITYLIFFSQDFTLGTDAAYYPCLYYIDVVNYK